MFFRMLTFLVLLLMFAGCSQKQEADLILYNGKVITLDDRIDRASAVAVAGDSIIAVGSDETIMDHQGDRTEMIDLDSATVVPGLTDAHIHIMTLGKFLNNLDLTTAKNWDEVIIKVEEAVEKAEPGEWILGRGWHQEKWDAVPAPEVQGYPVHDALSAISPKNPVYLDHASGHAVFANAKALQLCGIDRNTPDPDGGIIVRDNRGRATGVLLENAENFIEEAYDRYLKSLSHEQRLAIERRKLQSAMQHCLENGITSIHNAGSSTEDVDLFKAMADSAKLDLRLYVMLSADDTLTGPLLEKYYMVGYGNNHLTVRAIKEYADGALGARGAWMLEPYNDMPSTSGQLVSPLDTIRARATLAKEHGYQFCTHAIGDRANREVLQIYSDVLGRDVTKDHRWRVEHAQHISPVDLPRFVQNGVIASVQAVHCTSDGPWVVKRIGEERAGEGAYPWQSLLNSGARLANGTDAPVEAIDPIANFYASVTRKTAPDVEFYPQEAMTREQALRSLTIYNAYAAFEEDIKGSISPGKLADLTVLSHNLLTVPEEQIRDTQVLYTIVGGKILYRR